MIAAILAAAALPSARAPLFSATAAACADARLLASRAAAEEADAAVKAAYEAVRSDKSAAPALQQAQQLLSTLRHDEACRACEVSLLGCAGGESCAEALEALRAAGVSQRSLLAVWLTNVLKSVFVVRRYQYTLYFMCDSYIGCDQEYEFKVKVAEESDEEEEDEDEEEGEDEEDAAGRTKRKREEGDSADEEDKRRKQ